MTWSYLASLSARRFSWKSSARLAISVLTAAIHPDSSPPRRSSVCPFRKRSLNTVNTVRTVALGGAQVVAHAAVVREDRRGRTDLGAHVADGRHACTRSRRSRV